MHLCRSILKLPMIWHCFKEVPVIELYDAMLAVRRQVKSSGSTLLFIDDTEFSVAIKMLRYFYEDMPEIHVIAAGSLLETMLNRQISSGRKG